MRINKYIAHAGIASRRKAEELIRQGKVSINGQVVRELATNVKSGDRVEVEGQPIYNEEKVYYLLNKPRGVISSVSDDKGRKTVVDITSSISRAESFPLLVMTRVVRRSWSSCLRSRSGFIRSVVWTGILLASSF